jgi:hypothetical protein
MFFDWLFALRAFRPFHSPFPSLPGPPSFLILLELDGLLHERLIFLIVAHFPLDLEDLGPRRIDNSAGKWRLKKVLADILADLQGSDEAHNSIDKGGFPHLDI